MMVDKMAIATNLVSAVYSGDAEMVLDKKLHELAEAYGRGVIDAETSRFGKSIIKYLQRQLRIGCLAMTVCEWREFLVRSNAE